MRPGAMTLEVIDAPPPHAPGSDFTRFAGRSADRIAIVPPEETEMPAFAIAHLHEVRLGPEIFEYLQRIDETLVPYEGRFRVHGAQPEVLEGSWPGTIVVIEFPDLQRARAWYESAPYQQILRLRTDHSVGEAILVQGVEADYRATVTLERLRNA